MEQQPIVLPPPTLQQLSRLRLTLCFMKREDVEFPAELGSMLTERMTASDAELLISVGSSIAREKMRTPKTKKAED